jgi:hypothetical protein
MQNSIINEIEEDLNDACREDSECMEALGNCNHCRAIYLYECGYRKLVKSKWIPYSKVIEMSTPDGIQKKQITGWDCENCGKYSTGMARFCKFCGAMMEEE